MHYAQFVSLYHYHHGIDMVILCTIYHTTKQLHPRTFVLNGVMFLFQSGEFSKSFFP